MVKLLYYSLFFLKLKSGNFRHSFWDYITYKFQKSGVSSGSFLSMGLQLFFVQPHFGYLLKSVIDIYDATHLWSIACNVTIFLSNVSQKKEFKIIRASTSLDTKETLKEGTVTVQTY